jgi:shikimate dehydrogenase
LATLSGKTRVFCVLGHPVGHSLSPAMQNAALREMGVDGVYVPFDVPPERLAEAVRGLRALGAGGINCTIPHKEALLPLLDEVDEEASLIGAANTIMFREDRTVGYNTDAPGFLAALRAEGFEPAGRRAVVLGAGGSARAIVVALARLGAPVTVANRTEARARELAEELSAKIPGGRVTAIGLEGEGLHGAVEQAELLVNTTSAGMSPRVEEMPPVPESALHSGLFVYDLIYNPLETRLLWAARERGARVANGAGMLAHQGALALELWTGRAAPARLMQQIVVETLRRQTPRE